MFYSHKFFLDNALILLSMSSNDMKMKITDWLKEEKKLKEIEEKTPESWCIVAEVNDGYVRIINPSGFNDKVVARADVSLVNNGEHAFDGIGEAESIMTGLKMEINKMNTMFSLNKGKEKWKPKSISIGYEIYEDGLTKNELMRGITEVFKTVRHIQWFVSARSSYMAKLK